MNADDLGINPLSDQTERAITAAEIGTCRGLIEHLDVQGLEKVRRRLKQTDMLRICARWNLAEMRAVTLDAACRRLVELGRAPALYYVADMLPDVPDFPEGDGV
jgi:hypothetical protein